MDTRETPALIIELGAGEIFVFGSNETRRHGKDIAPLFERALEYKNIYLPHRFLRKLI